MVAAFDYCLHGKGGAAPSIDTAMHGLVDAAHVDHLHPDSGIAIATAADGEELTKEIFGDKVVWVPWRRPGFQLGLDIAAIKEANPQADRLHPRRPRHHRVGRHQRGVRDELALDHPHRRALHRRALQGRAVRPGARGVRAAAGGRAPRQGRRARADDPRASPRRTGRWSATSPTPTSCSTSWPRRAPAPGRARHVLPRPLPAHQGQAAGARPAGRRARSRSASPASQELHEAYRADYQAYYDRNATPDSPAMRGADPLIILVPGVGMFSYGKDKQTARVAGEFYVNAINVMRGAEGLSTYAPIDESEKFRIEYWALEEAKLQRMPKPKPLATRDRARHRRRVRHRQGHREASSPPRAPASSSPTCRWRRRRRRPPRSAAPTSRSACRSTCPTRPPSQATVDAAVLAFGGVDLVVNNAGLSLSQARCSRPPRRTGTSSTT